MRALRVAMTVVIVLALGASTQAYLVAGSVKMAKLVETADVVVKAKVVATEPIEDKWFTPYPHYGGYATELEVISTLKGELPKGKVSFQHYDWVNEGPGGIMFMPQHYSFAKGRTYIIFAKTVKETPKGVVLRQLWKHHKSKSDQGVVLAADETPVAAKSVKDAVWDELTKLLKAEAPADVCYAIKQLREMGNLRRYPSLNDFETDRVLTALQPLLFSKDVKVAEAAVKAIGGDAPYLDEQNIEQWLSTAGKRKFPGLAGRDAEYVNTGAQKYWQDLAQVADGHASVKVRATAIRAMGWAKEPAIFPNVTKWLGDPEPSVRRSAALLLGDFAEGNAVPLLKTASADEDPGVRVGVALAVGFGQFTEGLPLLERLVKDDEINVRHAAAKSLLSFEVRKVERILKANKDGDFKAVFVNALAQGNPEPYLDDLIEIVERRLEPPNWWGGHIPCGVSWKILFKYLGSRETTVLKSGKLKRQLDALERMKFYSSSEPRDLYRLYVKTGMTERAQRFRRHCMTLRMNMEKYLKEVDDAYNVEARR